MIRWESTQGLYPDAVPLEALGELVGRRCILVDGEQRYVGRIATVQDYGDGLEPRAFVKIGRTVYAYLRQVTGTPWVEKIEGPLPTGLRMPKAPPTSEPEADKALRAAAEAAGAREELGPRRVTADGYTRLPEDMVAALCPGGGGIMFLPNGKRWEAWPWAEVREMLKG